MICSICGDELPNPAPTGQRLARKCQRHYVAVNSIILVVHKSPCPMYGAYNVGRAQVTAVRGQGFSYKLVVGFDDPFYVGMRLYTDEGIWWTRDLSDEAAGALHAANALAA